MGNLANVYVTVMPDMARFGPDVTRQLGRIDADREGKKVGKKFGDGLHATVGKAAVGLGALFAGGQALNMFKGFIDGARESARIGRLTEQVVKSTGGAAKITAQQVGDLAGAISNKTGADDEAIQSGANLVLTFTNVKNAAGKNNDIFNQTVQAATDVAAAMNNGEVSASGLKSSSLQLGKALNDPIKGVSALTKVGVSFTEQQKKQIAALVKSGDTLGAQKIILSEVNKEFGGAAKAAADPMQRLSVIAGGLGESIGGLLLPYVDKFASFLSDTAIPAVESFAGWISENRKGLTLAAKIIGVVVAGLVIYSATVKIVEIATASYAKVQLVLNGTLTANPIGLVVVGLVALAAGLIYAYKKSDTFRAVVDKAFKVVSAAAKFMWENVLKPTFKFLIQTWLTVAGAIVHGAATAFGWVPGLGGKLRGAAEKFDKFKRDVNNSLDGINNENVDVTARFHNGLPKTLYGVRLGGGTGSRVGGITLAAGGAVRGAGTGTSDSIPAALSNNEHVWTAREVSAAGGHGAVEAIRRSVLGFAKGGAVGVPTGRLNAALGRGSNEIAVTAAKAVMKALSFNGAFNANLVGGLNFAKSQAGKPYVWGGVGPGGYDCSGFMSAILNVVQGRRPFSRRFSTGTFPAAGFVPGPGAFMIGSRRGVPGHMAGTINGVNVESSGDIGAHYGAGARGARDSMFDGVYHLAGYARGGRVGGDAPWDLLNARGRAYGGQTLREAILGGLPSQVMDSGGWLPPGRSIVDNQTGFPEPLHRGVKSTSIVDAIRLARAISNDAATKEGWHRNAAKAPWHRNAAKGQPGAGGASAAGMDTVAVAGWVSVRMHPSDIRAVGRAVGDEVLNGIGQSQMNTGRSADLLVRGG